MLSQTTKITSFVNRFLTRLFLVAALLGGFLGSRTEVKQRIVGNGQKSEDPRQQSRLGANGIQEQIRQNDGWLRQVAEEPQSPVESSLRSAPSSHRVASTRSSRLLPTHGGRPGQHHGRGGSDGCCPLQTFPGGGFAKSSHNPGRVSSSPRLYYVIALRRLLC